MARSKGVFVVTTFVVLLGAACVARADETTRPVRERGADIGSVMGGGFSAGTLTSYTASADLCELSWSCSPPRGTATELASYVLLPTIELKYFGTQAFSLDLSVPLTTDLIMSAVLHGVTMSTQLIAELSLGRGPVRGVFGVGLGFNFVSGEGPGGSLLGGGVQIPMEAAVEFLSDSRTFGFQLFARPYLEGGSFRSAEGQAGYFGGALIFGFGFYGYVVHDKK